MNNRWLRSGFIALAMLGATSLGASANSLTFGNVTFSFANLGGNELQLTITNALNANNNNSAGWTGINYLEAFAIKPSGGSYSTASVTNVAGWNFEAGGLSASSSDGCNGHGAGFLCFHFGTFPFPTPPAAPTAYPLSNYMVFDIQLPGPIGTSVELKVDFWTAITGVGANCSETHPGRSNDAWSCTKTGSQLSLPIGVNHAPGPIVGAGLPGLIAASGALIGLVWRRRRRALA